MTKLQILLMDKSKTINDILKDINLKEKAFEKQNKSTIFFTVMRKHPQKRKYKNIWQLKYKNFQDYLNKIDNYENTALIYALRRNDAKIAKLIFNCDPHKVMNTNLVYIKEKVANFLNLDIKIHEELLLHKSDRSLILDLIRIPKYENIKTKIISKRTPVLKQILSSNNFKLIELYLKKINKIIENEDLKNKNTLRYKKLRKILNSRNTNGSTLLATYIKNNVSDKIFKSFIDLGVDINKKSTEYLNRGEYIEYDIFKNIESDNGLNMDKYIKTAYNNLEKPFKIDEKGIVRRKTNKFKEDEYPIHIAYKYKNFTALKILLEQPNIKARVKDKNGKTLLDKKNDLPEDLKKIVEAKFERDLDLTI